MAQVKTTKKVKTKEKSASFIKALSFTKINYLLFRQVFQIGFKG